MQKRQRDREPDIELKVLTLQSPEKSLYLPRSTTIAKLYEKVKAETKLGLEKISLKHAGHVLEASPQKLSECHIEDGDCVRCLVLQVPVCAPALPYERRQMAISTTSRTVVVPSPGVNHKATISTWL